MVPPPSTSRRTVHASLGHHFLGFGGVSGMSFEIAKFIAIIAVILFVVSLVMGGMRGRGPRV